MELLGKGFEEHFALRKCIRLPVMIAVAECQISVMRKWICIYCNFFSLLYTVDDMVFCQYNRFNTVCEINSLLALV